MLSIEARDTWVRAYALAGKCDAGGMLVLNGVRLGKEELYNPRIPVRRIELALEELINHGFLARHLDGAIEVVGWEQEQTTKEATRKRKSRDNGRDSHVESHGELYLKMWRSAVTNGVTSHHQEDQDISPTGVAYLPSVDTSPSGDDAGLLPAWPRGLIVEASTLRKKPIRDWTGPERFVAARLHCLLFANCTVNEKSNRANASRVASAFAGMASSRDYGDITLAEYVIYASKVHADRGGERWFDPWLVKAHVEFERA